MDDDTSKSIFDSSFQSSKKKKKKPNAGGKEPESSPLSDQEVRELVVKMRGMVDELNKKMGNVIEKTGVSKEEGEQILANPDQYDPKAWEKAQEQTEELRKKTEDIVGSKKGDKKKKKKKRGSFLAAKKKNWISMR